MAELFADDDDLFTQEIFDSMNTAPYKQSFQDDGFVAPEYEEIVIDAQPVADDPAAVAPAVEAPVQKASFLETIRQGVESLREKFTPKQTTGRHGSHAVAAKGSHAVNVADDEAISYEEPEDAAAGAVALKRVSSGSGRHAAGGSHASTAIKTKTEKAELTPAQRAIQKSRRKRLAKKAAKIGGISLGALVGASVIGAYAAGVVYFGSHAMPGVSVGGQDLSMLDAEQGAALIDEKAEDYRLAINGNDYYMQVEGADIDYTVDSASLMDAVIAENPKWLWPFKLTETRSYGVGGYCSWDNDKLTQAVTAYTEPHNEGVSPSEDAYVDFSTEDDHFIVFSEVVGNQYQPAKVVAAATVKLYDMKPTLSLGDEGLILPEKYADDAELVEDAEQCNGFLGADFDLVITVNDLWSDGSRVVDHIGNAELAQWIHIGEDGKAYFDKEAMYAWCEDYVEYHYTYREWRYWTRPDGVELKMAYGTYGWKYDKNEFYNRLTTAILCDKVGQVVVPCEQSAAVWLEEEGGLDWGDTYIDIEISTQIVRYYVDGVEVWRAPTVSGDINSDQGTPYGVFYITTHMKRNTHLTGTNPDGTPYDVPVDYWMPFITNQVGLHDNPNRTIFGWPWAFRDAGSHGCCNLPHDKAESLYGMVGPGTCVIVHW